MSQIAVKATGVSPETNRSNLRGGRGLFELALLFAGAAAVLFLLSNRVVSPFDEGILLTGAMRTAAGQILHKDFYYDYGPGQLYLLAGWFKLFGPSVLAERLTNAFFCSGVVVTIYVLARRFCGRVLTAAAMVLCIVWLIGLMMPESMMYPAQSLLALWTSWLVIPVRDDGVQRRRALGAGFLAAMMFLFRYDKGLGIVAANFMAIAIMRWMQPPAVRRSPKELIAREIGPYLAAFSIIVIPAAIAYLSVAPIYDLLYDVVIYMAKYYRVGRGQPLPKLQLGPMFREDAVYLLPIILVLGFWLAGRWVITRRRAAADESAAQAPEWLNLLVSLGIAAVMLSARGLVRAGVGAVCECIMACMLIVAILLEHRALLNVWLRALLIATTILLVVTGMVAARIQLFYPTRTHDRIHLAPLAVNWILTPNRQPPRAEFRSWCQEDTPITRGFCFLLDEDHMQAIRYLDAHTHPGDYLYTGLPHHDRIIMNDNVLYFAVQRLPAVRWSQFDPFLENRADIQQEMIGSLEQRKPPYVVLDSEYDNVWEPNGSSVHTGVHLLDNYIAAHYKAVQQYGELTILQRQD
jgi:hypothetical protein